MTEHERLKNLGKKYLFAAYDLLFDEPEVHSRSVSQLIAPMIRERVFPIAELIIAADRQESQQEQPLLSHEAEPGLSERYYNFILLLAGARAKFPELEALALLDQDGKPFVNIETGSLIVKTALQYLREGRHHERTTDSQRPDRPAYGTRVFETHWLEWPSNLFEGRWNHEGLFSETLTQHDNPPELAAPGDLLHLQECEDNSTTGRVIIYQITNLRQGDEGTLHIEADFVARKGERHE